MIPKAPTIVGGRALYASIESCPGERRARVKGTGARMPAKRIFSFWFGPRMSWRRRRALAYLRARSGVGHILIQEKNLEEWTNGKPPLHATFPFLSATHKSDYLRTYFMLNHGGGYADVKPISFRWDSYFDKLDASDREFFGYPEFGPSGVAGDVSDPEAWKKLVGACYYIFKPHGSFARAWMQRVHEILDENHEALRQHPGTIHPRAASGGVFQPKNEEERTLKTGYPLEWTEINGQIFHPLQVSMPRTYAQELPAVRWRGYR